VYIQWPSGKREMIYTQDPRAMLLAGAMLRACLPAPRPRWQRLASWPQTSLPRAG